MQTNLKAGSAPLVLISHHLCPYVQRAAIVLAEKGTVFDCRSIDLSAKPDWFLRVSPLGKTPVLLVDGRPIFESAVIVEYLEETQPHPMHPADPFDRAVHRSWIEVASATLNDIAGLYNAPDEAAFGQKVAALSEKFTRLEEKPVIGPYFAGENFSLVDAAFAPVFRYFDVFDEIGDFGVFDGKPKVTAWRTALAERPSVKAAVTDDYPDRLMMFLQNRNSRFAGQIEADLTVQA